MGFFARRKNRVTLPKRTMTARRWLITIFADEWNVPAQDDDSPLRLVVGQREIAPSTGRKHYQLYVECRSPVRLRGVKRLLEDDSCHGEAARGSKGKCWDYCTKDESRDPDRHDIRWPADADRDSGGQGKRNDLDQLRAGMREAYASGGSASAWQYAYDTAFGSAVRYERGLSKWLSRLPPPIRDVPPVVEVHEGSTGTGKTLQAFQRFPTLFSLPPVLGQSIWFDGYDSEGVALFDDFNCEIPITFLLRLLDPYPLRVPVKGSHVWWSPKTIIFTTNIPFTHWYQNADIAHRAALQRRITRYVSYPKDRDPFDNPHWRIPDIG